MSPSALNLGGLQGKAGTHLGFSDWHEVSQEQVDMFAEATGDHQWIHTDPERAKRGPSGLPWLTATSLCRCCRRS